MRTAIVIEMVTKVTVYTAAGSTPEQVEARKAELLEKCAAANTKVLGVEVIEVDDSQVPSARPG